MPGPTYVDADLPDGEHCYRVAAMDIAGNISADSNELCVFLDNREPAAVIFDPEDGARFDAARTIRAESPDLDIATVSFEYQPVGETVWTVIAVDGDGEPFETLWNIAGIDFGDYLLRAVATDIGTRSDPAPATLGVTLGDVTPPGAPSDLTARVVGDTVEIAWVGVTDKRPRGLPHSSGTTRWCSSPVRPPLARSIPAFSTATTGTPSAPSISTGTRAIRATPPPRASTRRPSCRHSPVFETADVDLPGAGAAPGATARLFDAGTTDEVAAATADASGGFLYSALSLPLGSNVLEAEATDADANVSRRSNEALLIRNDVPAQPTGFVAVASGDDANLSWDPNGEADLSGYLITRDGEVVNTRGLLRPAGPIPTGVTVAASVNEGSAPGVIGSGRWSMGSNEEQWIELTLAEPRHLDQIRLLWTANRAAKDYDLLIELEGRLAPIVRVRDQAPTFLSEHTLPIPVQTSHVRLHIFSGATPFGILLDELELIGVLPETTTAFADRPPAPGVYDYAVEAIDTLGGRSLEAGLIALGVGDLTPPAVPTLTATVDEEDVLLSWPTIADAVRYRIFRNDVPLRETTLTFVRDNNLLNGTYAYHVTAIDAAGNESGPSNVEIVTVDVAPPPAPVLIVTPLAIGRALSLSWTESIGPLGVSSYVVSRSTTMGGPYSEIASVGGSTFAYLDSGLEGGVEYFYVVHAVDFRGEASDLSNEASGIPTDTVPPRAPVWISPESPLTVTASRIDLIGAAEPATTVEVFRDGASIGTALVPDEFRLVAEPFLRSTSNISGRFAVSPDRTVVAEVGSPSSFGANEVRLYDLRTGAVRAVPYQEDRSSERRVSFSPSGRYIGVATIFGSPINFAIRILDLETETTEVLALTEAPQAPAFLNDDELAIVVGDDIRIFDLTLDTERIIYTATSFFSPENLAASTDGAYVAWNESGELYVMPVTGGAPELVFDSFLLEDFVWSDARTLVFEAFHLGLHFYDVDTLSTVSHPRNRRAAHPDQYRHRWRGLGARRLGTVLGVRGRHGDGARRAVRQLQPAVLRVESGSAACRDDVQLYARSRRGARPFRSRSSTRAGSQRSDCARNGRGGQRQPRLRRPRAHLRHLDPRRSHVRRRDHHRPIGTCNRRFREYLDSDRERRREPVAREQRFRDRRRALRHALHGRRRHDPGPRCRGPHDRRARVVDRRSSWAAVDPGRDRSTRACRRARRDQQHRRRFDDRRGHGRARAHHHHRSPELRCGSSGGAHGFGRQRWRRIRWRSRDPHRGYDRRGRSSRRLEAFELYLRCVDAVFDVLDDGLDRCRILRRARNSAFGKRCRRERDCVVRARPYARHHPRRHSRAPDLRARRRRASPRTRGERRKQYAASRPLAPVSHRRPERGYGVRFDRAARLPRHRRRPLVRRARGRAEPTSLERTA